MKLYTEEQILNAYYNGWNDRGETLLKDFPYYRNEFVKYLTPIKLPSDEEIEQLFPKTNTLYEALGRLGMIEGAKQLRDKIQGGNK